MGLLILISGTMIGRYIPVENNLKPLVRQILADNAGAFVKVHHSILYNGEPVAYSETDEPVEYISIGVILNPDGIIMVSLASGFAPVAGQFDGSGTGGLHPATTLSFGNITVEFSDSSEADATFIAHEPDYNLVFLSINMDDLKGKILRPLSFDYGAEDLEIGDIILETGVTIATQEDEMRPFTNINLVNQVFDSPYKFSSTTLPMGGTYGSLIYRLDGKLVGIRISSPTIVDGIIHASDLKRPIDTVLNEVAKIRNSARESGQNGKVNTTDEEDKDH